jgi:cellulose synthase/poly-beta-1,6-N-acetylglucosamine synthase-like glycosyltransferase
MENFAGIAADAALVAWVAIAAIACVSVLYAQSDRPPLEGNADTPAVLIIPVRGVPGHLDAMWQGICAQTYCSLRVIFAVESTDDPAYAAVRALRGGPAVEIVVAGPTGLRGQKVHNMLAALRTLQPGDDIVVFADADIVPKPDWLARLIRALDDDGANMVSGYRWSYATDNRWATAFVCVINSSVATAARRSAWNIAWGGSMVLRRQTVEALDLERCWGRAVLDDLPLSRAVKEAGIGLRSPRDTLVPGPVSFSWKDAIAFGRRQYLFVRMHAPLQWVMAAGATTLPLIGWAVALPLAFGGDGYAIGAIVSANVLDQVRATLRQRVPRKLWGTSITGRTAWLDRWGTPAYLLVHAVVVWSTLFGRSITWAGRTYRLDGRQRVVSVTGPAA